LFEGFSIIFPDQISAGGAQHLWMAGGFGLMTLTVMARATLGHTGQDLIGGRPSIAMIMCVIGSVLCRISASIWPDSANLLFALSAAFWIGAFTVFLAIYGALLLWPKPVQP
jgi:uncharacterized protein involved in response to NO